VARWSFLFLRSLACFALELIFGLTVGLYCHSANGHFQNDLLRSKWGFDGIIVSDCGAIAEEAEVTNHNYTNGNVTLAVALSIKAGTDTNCGNEIYRDQIKLALDEGLLTEADLDTAVSRILKASIRLGEFEGNQTGKPDRTLIDFFFPVKHASNFDLTICVLWQSRLSFWVQRAWTRRRVERWLCKQPSRR
jgi:hypothetical protein